MCSRAQALIGLVYLMTSLSDVDQVASVEIERKERNKEINKISEKHRETESKKGTLKK